MLLDLLTFVVIAYVGFRLVLALRRSTQTDARRRSVELLLGLRLRHFALGPLALAGVFTVLLLLYQLPPLRFGWWTAIGGNGNIIFGSTKRTQGTPLDWIVPLVFGLLLLPALPLLVEREERTFRMGAEHWSRWRRVRRVVEFGLIHLVMGIPIAAALALSVGGAYLMWAYLRGHRRGGDSQAALDESTRAHLAYDIEVVLFVLVAFAIG